MTVFHKDQNRVLQPDLYQQLLYFVVGRVSDVNVAQDITQDVLERFAKQPPNTIRNPLAWLYRTARNAVVDHYRTQKLHEPLDGSTVEVFDSGNYEAPNRATQELAACLQPMINSLPAKYSDALQRVEIDGLSQIEAAKQENISVSAMKSRVQRGRQKLAEVLHSCCAISRSPSGEIVGYVPRQQGSQCS